MKSNGKIYTAVATAHRLAPNVEAGPKKAPGSTSWKPRIRGILLAGAVSILGVFDAPAATIYVDPVNGNDGFSGTAVTPQSDAQTILASNPNLFPNNAAIGPVRSLNRALYYVVAGDVIKLRGGAYRYPGANPGDVSSGSGRNIHENTNHPWTGRRLAVPWVNGTADAPIRIESYENEKPILKGSLRVTGWVPATVAADGITSAMVGKVWKRTGWEVDATGELDQTQRWRTQTGSSTYNWDSRFSNPQQVFVSASETVEGTVLKQVSWPHTATTAVSASLSPPQTWWPKPPARHPQAPDMSQPPYNAANSPWQARSLYWGDNGEITDMTAGTFFYREEIRAGAADISTIYVWLPGNADPNTKCMEASTSHMLFRDNNPIYGHYLHMKGLTWEHSNSLSYGQAFAGVGLGKNAVVEDCDIRWCDAHGVAVGADSKLLNSRINHHGQTGFCGGAGLLVDGCVIRGNNYRSFSTDWACGGTKIAMAGKIHGMTIQNCEFTENYGSSIWFDYMDNEASPYTVIRNNYFHDNIPHQVTTVRAGNISGVLRGHNSTIFLECSRNFRVYGNLLARNGRYAYSVDASENVEFFNNVILHNDSDYVGDGLNPFWTINIAANGRTENNGDPSAPQKKLKNHHFHHNIVAYSHDVVQYSMQVAGPLVEGNTSDYNVFWKDGVPPLFLGSRTLAQWQGLGFDTHSTVMEPGIAGYGLGLTDSGAKIEAFVSAFQGNGPGGIDVKALVAHAQMSGARAMLANTEARLASAQQTQASAQATLTTLTTDLANANERATAMETLVGNPTAPSPGSLLWFKKQTEEAPAIFGSDFANGAETVARSFVASAATTNSTASELRDINGCTVFPVPDGKTYSVLVTLSARNQGGLGRTVIRAFGVKNRAGTVSRVGGSATNTLAQSYDGAGIGVAPQRWSVSEVFSPGGFTLRVQCPIYASAETGAGETRWVARVDIAETAF